MHGFEGQVEGGLAIESGERGDAHDRGGQVRAISEQLEPGNVLAVHDLAEKCNAPELSKACALFCLRSYKDMLEILGGDELTASYSETMKKMVSRLRDPLIKTVIRRASPLGT